MRVKEIFPSLQGEGVWSGMPMTFVRLAGCNALEQGLECVEWCDTRESWSRVGGTELTPREVANRVDMPRACITGGEPLLQGHEVAALIELLHDRGVGVHLETNGTLAPPLGERWAPDWITVSPKPPRYHIAPELKGGIHELKLIVDGGLTAGQAEELARQHPGAAMVLQPEHSRGEAGLQQAVEMVLAHPKWRLSIQLHKVIGIP